MVDKTAPVWYPVVATQTENQKPVVFRLWWAEFDRLHRKRLCTMDYITYLKQGQVVKLPAAEVLEDGRFSWRDKKVKTVRLAELYEKAGYQEYSERARTCATWLQYGVGADGSKQLSAANFCQLRMCPMCTARRARKAAWKLSQVLNKVEAEHGAKFLFLTLTMKNVHGDQLGDALEQLTKGWIRFTEQRQVERSIKGWFRAIEITRSGRQYHPHLHAILAVEPDYFSRESRKSGKYLNQSELIERWQKALRVDYRPSVRIQTTRAKAGEGQALAAGGGKAALEAGKYAVKDEDYIDPKLSDKLAVEVLRDYTNALHRRRLTAFGGWMKEAAKALDADNVEEDQDLVHADDDSIREDLAEMIETYNWHFGAGDYILARREANPLKIKRADSA